MSTQEPYFDISKKRKITPFRMEIVFSAFLLGACVSSCLVTDTIEFEDAVNHPPEIVEAYPQEHILTVCDKQTLVFWAVIWDPDADEISESLAAASLSLVADTAQTIGGSCTEASKPIIYSERGERKESGALIHFGCSATLKGFNKDSLIEATLTISDTGFIFGANTGTPNPRTSANVLVERWTLKVEDGEICSPFR